MTGWRVAQSSARAVAALARWCAPGKSPVKTAVRCEDQGHAWQRVCTTVIAREPCTVEYRCRRCAALAVDFEQQPWR